MKPAQLIEQLEALIAPIDGADPAGVDLRNEKIYDEIKKARRAAEDKLTVTRPRSGEGEGETQQASMHDEPAGPGPEQDWVKVEKLSVEALTKKSKDLQLAVWLLDVQTRMNGFEGAAAGLRVLHEIITRFWDGLYPRPDEEDDEPLAMRLGIMVWLEDQAKFPRLLKQLPVSDAATNYTVQNYDVTQATGEQKKAFLEDGWPTGEMFERGMNGSSLNHLEKTLGHVTACQEQLALLSEVSGRRFVVKRKSGDGSERVETLISFVRAREVLETCQWLLDRVIARKRPAETPASAPSAESTATGGDSSEQGSDAASPIAQSAAAAPVSTRDQAMTRLGEAAGFLLTEDSTDPTSYLLSRAVAFGALYAHGDLSSAEPLPSPPSALRERLRGLVSSGDPTELINESEKFLRETPKQGWLDLQRYVITALEQLGGSHSQVASVLEAQVKALLALHPGLADAEFGDGTPVANHDSHKWMRERGLTDSPSLSAMHAVPAPAPVPAASAATPEPEAPQIVGEKAMALARAGRVSDALAMLQLHIDGASSGRERFLRKLELAEICFEMDRAALAFPVLDELASAIERARLDEWEEKTVIVRAWAALVRCCRALDGDEAKAREKVIFERLCRLDLAKALSLDKDATSSPSRWRRR